MSLSGTVSSDKEIVGKIGVLNTIHGKSAYEIALLYGFEGTEKEWLDFIENNRYFLTEEEKEDVVNRLLNKHLLSNYVTPQMFGAIGDNATDDYKALNDMFKNVGDSIIYDETLKTNALIQRTVNIPTGIYRVKTPDLLNGVFRRRSDGLLINGNNSTIVCEGFEGALFKNNDKLLNVDICNLHFVSLSDATSISRVLLDSDSDGGAQAIRFHSCDFGGVWKNVVNLTGSNCNSEYIFDSCTMRGSWEAFLHIGATDTTDQFLNYWFNNCKYWCSSPWIVANKGGHFNLNMCDVSGFQPSKETYLFQLLGASHSQGVTRFVDNFTRYELKNENSKILKCEWDNAQVIVNGIDCSSSLHIDCVRDNVYAITNVTNGNEAIYSFTNSKLIGRMLFSTGNKSANLQATFDNCILYGDSEVTNINDIIKRNYLGSNANSIFNIILKNVKEASSGNAINGCLGSIGQGQRSVSPSTTENICNPYGKTDASWVYAIKGRTIIHDVIMMPNIESDGSAYKLAVVSESPMKITNVSGKTITVDNLSCYVGEKYYIGNSNTIYTVVGMNLSNKTVTFDVDLEGNVTTSSALNMHLCQLDFQPNRDVGVAHLEKPIFVSGDLKLRNIGGAEAKATGFPIKIAVIK